MPLGDSYATLVELQTRLGGTSDTAAMTNALAVASRGIEQLCGRQFNVAGSASARVFYPRSQCLAIVDDISTTSGLIIKTDAGNDGAYETTWAAATDYQLEPLNGVVDGQTGWPYWRIRAVGGIYFPSWFRRAPLEVTANWGWAAVPTSVKEACLAVAEETYKLKDAPFGVAGMAEWGVVRVKANPLAMAMIAPYRRDPVLVA